MKNGNKKFSKKTGLFICILCFLVALVSVIISLNGNSPYLLYRMSLYALTFSLTFGLIISFNTNWKQHDEI